MSSNFKVLVTGSAGAIGQPTCVELQRRGHTVRGLDRKPTPNVDDAVVGNIADPEAVERAFADIDTLVHLAAKPGDGDFINELLEPNVIGLYRVMDAARRHRVRRAIVASSIQAVWGRDDRMATVDDLAPTNHYALTKVWAERMGEMYHQAYGMSALAVRICWCPRTKEHAQKLASTSRGRQMYLSRRDAGRFFADAVDAEDIGFEIVYAIGPGDEDGKRVADPEPAKRLLGFEGRDVFPAGVELDVE